MSYTLLRYFSTSILVTEHTMSMVLQMGLAFTGILVPYHTTHLSPGFPRSSTAEEPRRDA